ncbi:MAG: hypothetical protein V2I82_07895 [Halieaceae bacterium]|jgi:hypothetical protein|nr:hypothetical protein [Halieaceae bacterium]
MMVSASAPVWMLGAALQAASSAAALAIAMALAIALAMALAPDENGFMILAAGSF